jgi:hypothetical protein
MRERAWLKAAFVLAFVLGSGGCRGFVTEPITRLPVISSVVAFPTTLGPGDSTLITINATNPNGGPLVYDWEPYNGLVRKGSTGPYDNTVYHVPSASMVFYRSPTWPYPNDTAFVFCSATDGKGGYATRQVLIYYKN